ncbi:uncharacterized protein LOC135466697 [Liolophura sinensis]|uniref:uncharacterized protein LOC135466697 n=1 Tax=Liolophura sinensis TaxID=3198878 RepID=UPI003159630D
MPLSQRFRTPYREKNHMRFESGRETGNEVSGLMQRDDAGDMLDLIGRSQKSSQIQIQGSKKAVKVKLTRAKKPKAKVAHKICSEPKSCLRMEQREFQKTPLQDSENAGLTPPRQEIQSSEIYDFPESPNQDRQKVKRDFNKRLAERQVLRTIQKMAEELRTLRLRQQHLRRSYLELLA